MDQLPKDATAETVILYQRAPVVYGQQLGVGGGICQHHATFKLAKQDAIGWRFRKGAQ